MNAKTTSLFVVLLTGILAIGVYPAKAKAEKENASAPTQARVFRLAVQPTTKPTVAFERYQPLVDYLNEATKLNIELAVTSSYEAFSNLQKGGSVDFIIQDAFSTYLIAQHTELLPMANVISPGGKFHDSGFIIVKADSSIKQLRDLKGRTLLFGPKANAAKFFAPYILLKTSGIDIERNLTYMFGGMCPHNAMSVFLGEYDAGLVCGLYMAQPNKRFNFETDLRVIAQTGDWTPYWIVSASKKTDEIVVNNVKDALLELDMKNPKTHEVLSICKWKGFTKYSGEIDIVEKLVKKYAVPH